jgi:hypothetical protein
MKYLTNDSNCQPWEDIIYFLTVPNKQQTEYLKADHRIKNTEAHSVE